MSELNYKELQEKGVFDVPYKAFQFMQHQQSKIDELTKQRDSFIKAYEIEIDKSVELQKRIDEALEDLEYPTAPWDETIGSVVKVLRGDE